jgi:hypothetical protein
MIKDKLLSSQDFKSLVEDLMIKLKNGEGRFTISNYSQKDTCLNNFPHPDISERLSSDYGVSSDNKNIETEYFEEITLIEKILEDKNFPIKLADWQKRAKIESAEKMYKGLNRRAYAMQIWDFYAIPWRYKNNSIHVIWSPHDIMGTPIIHSYSIDSFLTIFSTILENKNENQIKLTKHLNFWKNFGIITIIILIFLFIIKLG